MELEAVQSVHGLIVVETKFENFMLADHHQMIRRDG
jgi:hypothetical protein